MNDPAPAQTSHRHGLAARLAIPFELDTRSLAVYRMGLGALLVVDAALRSRDFRLMFAPDGIFPLDGVRHVLGDPAAWSLAFLVDATWWGGAVLALEAIAGLSLALGWRTRVATILSWLAFVSVMRRTIPATNAGDAWLACQLFWAMFVPLGESWSLDALPRGGTSTRPRTVCSIATAAVVLQLCAVYFGAGLAKCTPAWGSGTAIAHALSVHDHGTPLGSAVARSGWITTPLNWTIPVAELAVPLLVLALPGAACRRLLVAGFVGFHLVIWMLMSVGLFAPVAIVAWLPLLPCAVWHRPPTVSFTRIVSPRGTTAFVCGVALVLAASSLLRTTCPALGGRLPRILDAGTAACCLTQEWGMFGDVPARQQWVYGRGELADGRLVDVLRGGVALETERPAGGFSSLAHHRWHKLFWMMPAPRMRPLGPAVAAALADDWNARHVEQARLLSLEIHFAVSGTDGAIRDEILGCWPPRDAVGGGNLDRAASVLRPPEGPPEAPGG